MFGGILGSKNLGRGRANCIFIEKNPSISEPMQLKPMFFKGQMYFNFLENVTLLTEMSVMNLMLEKKVDKLLATQFILINKNIFVVVQYLILYRLYI